MKPPMQERFQIYVMGPRQDVRLASVGPGQVIEHVILNIDLDAPFILRARALRQTNNGGTQTGSESVKTQWTGPDLDYRQGDYILESLQMPYLGQNGSPKPICPEIVYPPGGVITLDLQNSGLQTITNLTFYWIGVNLYPWGSIPVPSYPSEFRGLTFAQPFIIHALLEPSIRLNQPYKVKPDGDFVIRGGQASTVINPGGGPT